MYMTENTHTIRTIKDIWFYNFFSYKITPCGAIDQAFLSKIAKSIECKKFIFLFRIKIEYTGPF